MLFTLAVTNLLIAKMSLLKGPAASELPGKAVDALSLAVLKARLGGL